MSSNVTPRQAALWFASKGHAVLPLHAITDTGACTCGRPDCPSPGKHPFAPFVPHGAKDAVTNGDTIVEWFTEHYWLNYGVATDTLLVIDVDTKHDGMQRWAELRSEPTRALIHTWEVRTGSGGRHVMFKNTPDIRCGVLDKGIDIRGVDGYIVGPQCKHKSGGVYHWLPQSSPTDVALAELPAWLLTVIKTQSHCGRPKSIQDWRAMAGTRLADGARHDVLNRLIGHFLSIGADAVEVREMMLGWNRGMCDPPIPDREVIGAVVRIAERELNKHRWLQ